MRRFFRRRVSIILKALATGSFTLILAACYGVYQVMYGVPANLKSGLIQVRKRSDGTPLKGIRISFKGESDLSYPTEADGEGIFYTDENGEAEYTVEIEDDQYSALLEDVDGLDNGGSFASTSINIDEEVETVELEEE